KNPARAMSLAAGPTTPCGVVVTCGRPAPGLGARGGRFKRDRWRAADDGGRLAPGDRPEAVTAHIGWGYGMRDGESMKSNDYRKCRHHLRAAAAVVVLASLPMAALADCGNGAAGFSGWLHRFKARAAAQGIGEATLSSALRHVSYSPRVVRLDRSQRSFKLSFEEFYARRVGTVLIRRGRARMRQHGALLNRIEERYGVPA